MQRNANMVPYAPSTNTQLATALTGMGDLLRRAAEAELSQNPEWDDYSETEKRSMILIDALRKVNGFDLAAIQLRYSYLLEIERTNALTVHPAGYGTLAAMAAEQGISASEYSKIKDLCGIVFPYLSDTLGMNIAEVFSKVGKTKFFELLPAFKVLITGRPSDTASVNVQVDYLIDNAIASYEAAGNEIVDTDAEAENDNQISRTAIREELVSDLVEDAGNLPWRELRTQTRAGNMRRVPALSLRKNGICYFIAEMDEEEYRSFERVIANRADITRLDIPEDRLQRQVILLNRPEFRSIYDMMEE